MELLKKVYVEGVHILIGNITYLVWLGVGYGITTKAKIIAYWALLIFAS